MASISLAAIVFYVGCRALRVEELRAAFNAIAGRFTRLARK
jgi:hypothetical protein